jgi:hypothetical protein
VAATAGTTTKMAVSWSKNDTSTRECIGLAECINFGQVKINEVEATKAHIWRYPFNMDCSGQVSFPMNHVSEVQYEKRKPVDAIFIIAQVVLHFTRKAKRHIFFPGKRAPKHIFHLKDAKQAIMKYTVRVKSSEV